MFADFLSFDVTDFPFGLRPGCERCGARMMLARIAAYDPSAEIWWYECPICNHVQTERVPTHSQLGRTDSSSES